MDTLPKSLIVDVVSRAFRGRNQFRTIHGVDHWERVASNAHRLVRGNSDATLFMAVELFALYHDSHRMSEGTDMHHGVRGSIRFMDDLTSGYLYQYPEVYQVADVYRSSISFACRFHSIMNPPEMASRGEGKTPKQLGLYNNPDVLSNLVVAMVDADRLDIWRARRDGVDPSYLFTDTAKRIVREEYVNGRPL